MPAKPLWFNITLIDCNGQHLAMWAYDEHFPVTAPQFSYPNQDDRCPFTLRISHVMIYDEILPTGNINVVISHLTGQYARKFKAMAK